jgi:hypothetical protein
MASDRKRQSPRAASIADVEAAIENMPEAYLDCRDNRHPWERMGVQWSAQAGTYVRTRICPRCTTRRTQEIGADGEIIGTHYDYPDDYLLKIGRLIGSARDTLRLASVLREINSQNTPEPRRRRTRKATV